MRPRHLLSLAQQAVAQRPYRLQRGLTIEPTRGRRRSTMQVRIAFAAAAAAALTLVGCTKALFMTVWCPDSRSVESNCGIPRG